MSDAPQKRARTEALPETTASPAYKISQRPSKSCTECIRRKTRCDKRKPCEPCSKRKVGHLCRFESQYRDRSPSQMAGDLDFTASGTFAQNVVAELEALRRRVSILEKSSTSGNGVTSVVAVPSSRLDRPVRADSSNGDGMNDSSQDAGTTLEYLALGMDRRLGSSIPARQPSARRSSREETSLTRNRMILPDGDFIVPESVLDALLPRSTVTAILRFAEVHCSWQHCCVYFPYFEQEVDAFWRTISPASEDQGLPSGGWSAVEPTWVALLYVLMGIAVHQMTTDQAITCGLAEADRLILPNALISAAEDALYAGSFLARPSMWTVQAIAVLSLCGHNVCDSDLLSSLLAVGVKTAQALGLHCLGRRSEALAARQQRGDDLTSPEDLAEIIDLEIGTRVWWGLVLEDWFSIPFRGVWTIHPDLMDTPLPNNCDDQDLQAGRYVSKGSSQMSIATKHRFSAQIAVILQRVFQGLRKVSDSAAICIVRDATSEIEAALASLPSALRLTPVSDDIASSVVKARERPYIAAMRHYLQISARHKLLVIYRAYLARGHSRDNFEWAHAACLDNAKAILQELHFGQQQECPPSQSLWTIPYHAIAAAIVLALDLMQGEDHEEDTQPRARARKQDIHRAVKDLEKLAPTSRIARRGLQVLSRLFKEIDSMPFAKDNHRDNIMTRMITDIRVPSNDMVESVGSDRDLEPTEPSGPRSCTSGLQARIASTSPFVPLEQPHFDVTQTVPWFEKPMSPRLRDRSATMAGNELSWNQDDIDRLLMDLQKSLPDVGRLFDGSIGRFNI